MLRKHVYHSYSLSRSIDRKYMHRKPRMSLTNKGRTSFYSFVNHFVHRNSETAEEVDKNRNVMTDALDKFPDGDSLRMVTRYSPMNTVEKISPNIRRNDDVLRRLASSECSFVKCKLRPCVRLKHSRATSLDHAHTSAAAHKSSGSK